MIVYGLPCPLLIFVNFGHAAEKITPATNSVMTINIVALEQIESSQPIS